MPRIYFASSDRKIEIELGKETNILRTSIRYEAGVPYRCGGGLCGTCRIRIEQGAENLTDIKKKEVERLGDDIKNGYRLACQSFATGDVEVTWDTSVTVNVPPKLKKYWESKPNEPAGTRRSN